MSDLYRRGSGNNSRDLAESVVRGQTSIGHHAVDTRMPVQGLSPHMQDAEEADLGAETLGIGGYFQERGAGGLEQEGNPAGVPSLRFNWLMSE
jgi:hypothetical protein